jgi:hypothetical protein
MGAILMPLFIWFFSRWMMKKIAMMEQSYQAVRNMAWRSLSFKHKIFFVVLFVMMFLFMQVLWRMMFEFLIAYMQIREALCT